MICKNCGTTCAETATFCNFCGYKLQVEEPETKIEEEALTELQTTFYSNAEEYIEQKPTFEETHATLIQSPKKKKRKKKRSFFGRFFGGIFSFLFMLVLIALEVVLLFRISCGTIVKTDIISTVVKNNPVISEDKDWYSVSVGELASSMGIDMDTSELGEDTAVSDVIYEALQEANIDVASKEQVEQMLGEIPLDDFLKDMQDDYLKVLTGEQDSASLKTEDIVGFVEENKQVVKDTLGIEITDEDINQFRSYIEDMDLETTTKMELPKDQEIEIITTTAYYLIGDNTELYKLLAVAIAVVLLLLLLCNTDKMHRVFVYAGIGTVFTGGIYLAVSMATETLLPEMMGEDFAIVANLMTTIGGMVKKNAILFLGIGVGMFLLYIITEIIVKITPKEEA